MLLDRFSAEQVRAGKARRDDLLQYHWDFYSALVFQRARVRDRITAALLKAAEGPFEFKDWQWAVRLMHVEDPLSTDGSLREPGGRFNIGAIDPAKLPGFPALYLAANKSTALSELFAQKTDPANPSSVLESALATPDSFAMCRINGRLESVINLSHPGRLAGLVGILRGFELPTELIRRASRLGLPKPTLVRNVAKLMEALNAGNWTEWPMQFDVPSTSQIFGQLVREAGIEGVVYASKFATGNCAAIFPDRLRGTGSYVDLPGNLPAAIKRRRLDGTTSKR